MTYRPIDEPKPSPPPTATAPQPVTSWPSYAGSPFVVQLTGATGSGLDVYTTAERPIVSGQGLDYLATLQIQNLGSVAVLVGPIGRTLWTIAASTGTLTLIGCPNRLFLRAASAPATTDSVNVLVSAPPFR